MKKLFTLLLGFCATAALSTNLGPLCMGQILSFSQEGKIMVQLLQTEREVLTKTIVPLVDQYDTQRSIVGVEPLKRYHKELAHLREAVLRLRTLPLLVETFHRLVSAGKISESERSTFVRVAFYGQFMHQAARAEKQDEDEIAQRLNHVADLMDSEWKNHNQRVQALAWMSRSLPPLRTFQRENTLFRLSAIELFERWQASRKPSTN